MIKEKFEIMYRLLFKIGFCTLIRNPTKICSLNGCVVFKHAHSPGASRFLFWRNIYDQLDWFPQMMHSGTSNFGRAEHRLCCCCGLHNYIAYILYIPFCKISYSKTMAVNIMTGIPVIYLGHVTMGAPTWYVVHSDKLA